MTRQTVATEDRSVMNRLRGLLTTPEEGWSTIIALLVLMLAPAMAIDDSRWPGVVAGTQTSQTAFLPVAVVLATLAGYLIARSRLGTFRSHLLGATIGAGYLLIAVSGAVSQAGSIQERLRALNESIATFVADVFVLGIRSNETVIFLLLVGSLLWAAAQLGAFALFRRHRPGPAIGLAATALLINMSITIHDQLAFLVVFVAAGLLLIVRTSLNSQLEQWRTRRIADSGYASQLFLRSGATFVTVAILSSLVLAANASSAPLRPVWDDALEKLVEVGISINHFMGGLSGAARGPNMLFTPTQTIREQWETSNDPVFTAITDDGRGYKWRGATYDYFDGRSWQQTSTTNASVPAFQDLTDVTSDRGLTDDRNEVIAEISSVDLAGNVIVAPSDPVRLDHDATVQTTAEGVLLDIRLGQNFNKGDSYVVTSRVLDLKGPDPVTEAELAAAGLNYGPMQRYVDVQPGAIGPTTVRITNNIVNQLPTTQRDPFHIAKAIQGFLFASGGFSYSPDVRGMCTGENIVDCFLKKQRGYCEYFATSMVMMLRTQNIPARYVVGYLPGRLEQITDAEGQTINQRVVERSASHAWVEVFFPGYGWVPFDPTPGLTDQGAEPTVLPSGVPRATAPPDEPVETPNFSPTPDLGGGPVVTPPETPAAPSATSAILPLTIALLVLGAAFVLVVLARRRRLPGNAQVTYDSVARMASRFGYAPLPSQTAYEYADRLAFVVPAVRDELRIVATAKVESVYARREPTDELRMRLLLAYRRVRTSLLRLLLRRPSWMSLRRKPPTSMSDGPRDLG